MNEARRSSTLFDKIWDLHLVGRRADGRELIYIDRHVLHDLHAPHAFSKLARAGRAAGQARRNAKLGRVATGAGGVLLSFAPGSEDAGALCDPPASASAAAAAGSESFIKRRRFD